MGKSVSLGRGIAIYVCFLLAPLLLGLTLATLTFFALNPLLHDVRLRPLLFANGSLLLILFGYLLLPENRPHPGALVLQILMIWSLVTGASVLRIHFHGIAINPFAWVVLVVCTLVFAAGAWLRRRTKWGKKWFVR